MTWPFFESRSPRLTNNLKHTNMNAQRTQLVALLALSSLFVSLGRADELTYSKILKERDSVLSQIVAQREGTFASGTTSDEALVAARLALWSFRRDTTRSNAEKIKQQELIVAVFQTRLATQKSRVKAGIAGAEDVLLATDSLLEAQQLFEELQLNAKKS